MLTRPVSKVTLPEPDRASEEIIRRCRNDIEGGVKRLVRRILIPMIRYHFNFGELGEGFHWPRNYDMSVAPGARIGRYAYLGPGFECHGPLVVGDLCMISAGMKIVGADHLYDQVGVPSRLAFPTTGRPLTVFEADVFSGQRVTVMEGVRVGRGAVIGSGSVVTKDVAPYTVVAGVPARFIKRRYCEDGELLHRRIVEP